MNLVITERDKKLLGFLAAFFIVLVFFLLVFKPLGQKNSQIKRELRVAKELEAEFDDKASSAQDMTYQEDERENIFFDPNIYRNGQVWRRK